MGKFICFNHVMPYGKTCALLIALALIVLSLTVRQIRAWHRLRHVPGPKYAGLSPWWQLSRALSGRYHEHLKEAAEQYGPLVRIGPNELLSTDPHILRGMSAVRSAYTKGDFYDSGKAVPGKHNVVSMRNEAIHKAMRTQMAPGFSGKENEGYSFEPGINRQLLSFVALIERKYISTDTVTRPLDFAEKSQFFALDAIGDVSLGAPFSYLARDEDLYDYNAINSSTLPVMNIVSVLPWLTDIVHRWPMKLMLPKEGDQVGFGRLMGFAKGIVDKRLSINAPPLKDMMQAHINNGMSREDLIQQVFLAIIAGSNSTAYVLRMIILSLTTSPPAYNKLINEIRSASAKVAGPISWAEAQTLPYLQAVVYEGLRLWPPVAGLGFKQVPAGGDIVNGYFVPGGTQIGQGFYGVGRSISIWGPDAHVFRPERWLVDRGEELTSMIATVETVFGYGKYLCLGKHIALMEIHKAVFELMRRYDFSILNAEQPIKVQASVFMFASDFWVRITKRELQW